MLDVLLQTSLTLLGALAASALMLPPEGEALGNLLDVVNENSPLWRGCAMFAFLSLVLRSCQHHAGAQTDRTLPFSVLSLALLAPQAARRARALRRALASVGAVEKQGRGANEQLCAALVSAQQADEKLARTAAELEKAQRDLETLKAQAAQQGKEYTRVLAENMRHESTISDYELLFGERRKKKS